MPESRQGEEQSRPNSASDALQAVRARLVTGLLIDEDSGEFRDAIQLPETEGQDDLDRLRALLTVLPTSPKLLVGWSVVGITKEEVQLLLGPSLGRVTFTAGTEMDFHMWWVDKAGLSSVCTALGVIPHLLAPAEPSWILDAPDGSPRFLFVEPNWATGVWKQ